MTSISPAAAIPASATPSAKSTENATRFHAGRVSSTSKTAFSALVKSRAPIEVDYMAITMPEVGTQLRSGSRPRSINHSTGSRSSEVQLGRTLLYKG